MNVRYLGMKMKTKTAWRIEIYGFLLLLILEDIGDTLQLPVIENGIDYWNLYMGYVCIYYIACFTAAIISKDEEKEGETTNGRT